MSNLALLINVLSAMYGSPGQPMTFPELLSNVSENEASFLKANDIDDWNDYGDYLFSFHTQLRATKATMLPRGQ